jgi:hypothetical protein
MDSYLGRRAPRRLFAAAGTGLGLANGVFTGIDVDVAPPLEGPPPEVDRLAVTVVTDSSHHNFESSGRFGAVAVERFQLPPGKVLRNSTGTRFVFGA